MTLPNVGRQPSGLVKTQREQKRVAGNQIYTCLLELRHGSSALSLLFLRLQTHWNSDHQLSVRRSSTIWLVVLGLRLADTRAGTPESYVGNSL